jgi:hypothetical protein
MDSASRINIVHDRFTTAEIYLNLSPEDAVREVRNTW